MSTARSTFSKRNREAALKDKAKLKEERRAAKRTEVRTSKGPEIAWDEAVHAVDSDDEPGVPAPAVAPAPAPASVPAPSAVDRPRPASAAGAPAAAAPAVGAAAAAAPTERREDRPTTRITGVRRKGGDATG